MARRSCSRWVPRTWLIRNIRSSLVQPLAEREPVVARSIEVLDPFEESIALLRIKRMSRGIRRGGRGLGKKPSPAEPFHDLGDRIIQSLRNSRASTFQLDR